MFFSPFDGLNSPRSLFFFPSDVVSEQVAVMTTEVFRNMLYDSDKEESELKDVFAVVFDEFHYMNDRDRGTVRQ